MQKLFPVSVFPKYFSSVIVEVLGGRAGTVSDSNCGIYLITVVLLIVAWVRMVENHQSCQRKNIDCRSELVKRNRNQSTITKIKIRARTNSKFRNAIMVISLDVQKWLDRMSLMMIFTRTKSQRRDINEIMTS